MKRLLFLSAIFFSIFSSFGQSQVISGNWWGTIELPGQSLKVGFEIISDTDGSISGSMDVPAQGATGIPVQVLKAVNDTLAIEIQAINARYSGVRSSDDLITGTFTQNGLSLDLNLHPGRIMSHRPQTPVPPYPYLTEEVTFENSEEGAVLSGTLTYPMMHFRYPSGSIPVVLMVTGSGMQNRDEEVYDHKPFAVLAHHLAINGIASLRYDDRGFAKSTGPVEGITTVNNKSDADAGIAYLRSLDKFGHIGVLGHSEGGTIAFMMGADSPVDFIVSMAGAAAKGIDVMLGQNAAALRLGGIPQSVTDQYCTALKIIFNDRIARRIVDDPEQYVDDICRSNEISLPPTLQANLVQVIPSGGQWMDWFLAFDPAESIRRISCPVFALNGTHDLQVLSKDNLPVLSENLPQSSLNLIKEYDSLNHLFQHCTYHNSMNYYAIEETISEDVLKDISDWIKKVSNQ